MTDGSDQVFDWRIGTRVPRTSVRALINANGTILCVDSLLDAGKLHLPGGGVDHAETLVDALERELAEELNVSLAKADYWLAIENLFPSRAGLYHTIEHVFIAEISGMPRATETHLRLVHVPLADIGAHPFYPQSLRRLLSQPNWHEQRYLKAGRFADDD
jgi:ADP-ribose pyrophosphatase YjhB (NUDIX family)